MPSSDVGASVGIVAIGRNEGDRLHRCIDSAIARSGKVVYVDSGSTDDSVEMARLRGAVVVSLDMSAPFTAARARNAGYERLMELDPDLEFVQFVDGDCEIDGSWIDTALSVMRERSDVVVVCGRRRERVLTRSVYDRLMDMEWNTPIGYADSCGGDSLIRRSAFESVGGFDERLIAGEEPELCLRLRREGGRIFRVGAEMTLHEANLMRFSQWWQRSIRAGYAYALGASMHGNSPERHCVSDVRRIWFWGALLPALSVASTVPTRGASLLALCAYPLLSLIIARRRLRSFGDSARDALLYGSFCMLGKFAQLLGLIRFHRDRLQGRRGALIEYK
jgi:GT2 family glycosyltransferase